MKNKILVLGHNGMLGHMVAKYLTDKGLEVQTATSRWPDSSEEIVDFDGSYIINCIGAIPQKNNNSYDINWHLPIWLDLNAPCSVIHPGTDCEMDIDEYGISKNVAGFYIKHLSTRTKSIKSSIIGPEIKGKNSLLEWFLRQDEHVFGYTGAIWNGNTTLEWAKQCLMMIRKWDEYEEETIIHSDPVSKYELLNIFKSIFDKDIIIEPKNLGKDKRLSGSIRTKNIADQMVELKEYYYKEKK